MPYEYETDGAAIYKQSFATIRSEADLARFDADEDGSLSAEEFAEAQDRMDRRGGPRGNHGDRDNN